MARNDNYTIPAKPTKYKGRLYRSRLEARVAALFDLCEWKFEYEPFDLDGWSPDFLIKFSGDNNQGLVEVKPDSLMFDITKYLKMDFYKYDLFLISPTDFYIIGKGGVTSSKLSQNPKWIEAGNQVMFLKPEVVNG